MTADSDWTRLRDLFDRTANLDAGERARLLDRECGDDLELRGRVEGMLAAHDEAGGFLAAPTEPQAGSVAGTRAATDPRPGTIIGSYKLLQLIGEGGFGVVYMAEQQQPIVRKVALKVIKLGMDTKQVIARFEAERQALALMDHPNIARIFDAGATETGRPYFVMELVHGIPITEYCDRERLTTRQRLELFIPICEAVAHAHQKGVIHRDLKPSNVLVSLYDEKPVPKVIDFGIARAIHQKLTVRTLFTEFGQFIGTPEYMSPEQSAMSGLDIDTRTDIYSLGALLYELLTGQKLFDPQRLRSLAWNEIQRVLRDEEPQRPSTRVSSLGASAVEIALRRGVQAPQLVRVLRGDPDWIVMKAIAKDRRQRYDSAGAFAADLERCLRSEPVTAGPPGLAYRASRAVRRHRVAAAVVLVLVTALALGAALAMVGLVGATRSERMARAEAARAEREARRNALEVAATRAMLSGDESTYIARVKEAIEIQRSTVPPDTLSLALYLTNLVTLIESLNESGVSSARLDSLRSSLDSEAIDLLTAVRSTDTAAIEGLDLLSNYVAQRHSERYVDVRGALLRLRQQSGEPDSTLELSRRQVANMLQGRGEMALSEGRAELARASLAEAAELWRAVGPAGRTRLAVVMGGLGAALTDLGRYAEAERVLLDAYAMRATRELLVHLVQLYERWGKPDKAHAYDARTRVASVREIGPIRQSIFTTLRGVGFSGKHGNRWIWLFGPVLITEVRKLGVSRYSSYPKEPAAANIRWNSWAWTTDRDARDGISLNDPVDAQGVPRELLALSPGERAERERRDVWLNVAPSALIEDAARSRSLLLYRKMRTGGTVGASFATWEHGVSAPRRLTLRPGTLEPTLLFQGDEPDLSSAAVTFRDTLYLFGGRPHGLVWPTVVARAPLARALERSAWRFFAGSGRWSADDREAVPVMNASPSFTVHWNRHLGRFIAFNSLPLDDRIEMRTADRPEGPWSEAEVIHTGLPPLEVRGFDCRAAAHPELARDGGRVEYLTYERPHGFLNVELRLIEVTLR